MNHRAPRTRDRRVRTRTHPNPTNPTRTHPRPRHQPHHHTTTITHNQPRNPHTTNHTPPTRRRRDPQPTTTETQPPMTLRACATDPALAYLGCMRYSQIVTTPAPVIHVTSPAQTAQRAFLSPFVRFCSRCPEQYRLWSPKRCEQVVTSSGGVGQGDGAAMAEGGRGRARSSVPHRGGNSSGRGDQPLLNRAEHSPSAQSVENIPGNPMSPSRASERTALNTGRSTPSGLSTGGLPA